MLEYGEAAWGKGFAVPACLPVAVLGRGWGEAGCVAVELLGSNALAVPLWSLQKSPLSCWGDQAGCHGPPVTCKGFSKGS